MQFITVILTILSLGTVIGSLLKPKWGAWCYLIYMFLAPYLYIGGFIIYARTIAFIFLAFFIFQISKKLKRMDYAPFMSYIILLGCSFLFVLTAEQLGSAFNSWINDVSSLFYIFYLYGIMKTDNETVKLYKWTLFGIMTVVIIYGLFLTSMPGINPYLMYTLPLFGSEFNEAYALGSSGLANAAEVTLSDERIFGRISSFFRHPMSYGLNLGFFLIYVLYVLREHHRWLMAYILIILTAIFTSGVRTPIGALAMTVIVMMLYLRKNKYFIWAICGFLAVIYLLPLISPIMGEYVLSIVSSDNTNVRGSTVDMRLDQLQGCFDIVKNDMSLGKGYNWTNWYNETYGGHPKALFFESLLFCIIVNSGIIGIVLWSIYGVSYCKYAQNKIQDPILRNAIIALLVFFFSYCMITGDFHLKNMYLFFAIMICFDKENNYGTAEHY